MPAYMLDTDTASYIMKRSHPNILRKLKKIPPDDICISAVVLSELRYGVAVSPSSAVNEGSAEVISQICAGASLFGEGGGGSRAKFARELKRQGTLIGGNDLLIAAHARCLGLTLVTNNKRILTRFLGSGLRTGLMEEQGNRD